MPHCGRLPSAVGVEHHVVGEHARERVDVAGVEGREERVEEGGVARGIRVEPRTAVGDAGASPVHDLPAGGLVAFDDGRDVGVVHHEHLAEDEHRALDGTEPLEHGEERERQRLVALDPMGGIRVVVGQGLGQPGSRVDLAGAPRRAQRVDREAGHDGRRERLGPFDVLAGQRPFVQAQVRLLHDVLGLRHAAEHAVGDGEHERSESAELRGGGGHDPSMAQPDSRRGVTGPEVHPSEGVTRKGRELMRVFIAGATGAVGSRLVPLLVAAGHEVVGTSRNAERLGDIEAAGASGVVMDGLDAASVRTAVLDARPDAIVHELSALGGGGTRPQALRRAVRRHERPAHAGHRPPARRGSARRASSGSWRRASRGGRTSARADR